MAMGKIVGTIMALVVSRRATQPIKKVGCQKGYERDEEGCRVSERKGVAGIRDQEVIQLGHEAHHKEDASSDAKWSQSVRHGQTVM